VNYCVAYVCLFLCLSACLSVCPFAQLKNHTAELYHFVHVARGRHSVLLWRSLRDIMYFRFCGWRHVFIPRNQWARIKHDVTFRRNSPGGGTSWTSRQLQFLIEFIRMWHRGRSLLSTIDLYRLFREWREVSNIWWKIHKWIHMDNSIHNSACLVGLIDLLLHFLWRSAHQQAFRQGGNSRTTPVHVFWLVFNSNSSTTFYITTRTLILTVTTLCINTDSNDIAKKKGRQVGGGGVSPYFVTFSASWMNHFCTALGVCRALTKLLYIGPGYYWDGWPSSGGHFGQTVSVCMQPPRPTQSPILCGTGNEYRPKCGDISLILISLIVTVYFGILCLAFCVVLLLFTHVCCVY